MKPILFNTEMVHAILEGRKTVTRRVVKKRYRNTDLEMFTNKYGTRLIERQNDAKKPEKFIDVDGVSKTRHYLEACAECKPQYNHGDILYVRETWAEIDGEYAYRADDEIPEGWHLTAWRPSIHMPREAARIFLRVTGVRAERLQEITVESAKREGAFHSCAMCSHWNDYCGQQVTLTRDCKIDGIDPEFPRLWNSTIKPADIDRYGWAADPWVWVIEFERCEKLEAEA